MTTHFTHLPALLDRAGFQLRAGADQATIAQAEAAFGVELPSEFAALWAYTDGAAGDGIDLLSLPAAVTYAESFAGADFGK